MRSYPALVWLTWLIVWVVVLVATTAAAGICGLVASGLRQGDRRKATRESGAALRASRRFADLIASGDFDAAEAAAKQAFANAQGSRVVEWNESAILGLSLEEARRELTEPESAATWFPDVQRVDRGEVVEVVLGGGDPVRLRVISEAWTPDLDGVVFETTGGAFSICGSLSLRTVVTGTDARRLKTAIEVLVHMETIDVPEARRALARARLITGDGLSRMAAMFEVGSP